MIFKLFTLFPPEFSPYFLSLFSTLQHFGFLQLVISFSCHTIYPTSLLPSPLSGFFDFSCSFPLLSGIPCPRPSPLRVKLDLSLPVAVLLPCPHLLPGVPYQSPQCHDYKGSDRNPCPCRSAAHRDQVTKRGGEPVPLVRL